MDKLCKETYSCFATNQIKLMQRISAKVNRIKLVNSEYQFRQHIQLGYIEKQRNSSLKNLVLEI
jgi:2'-5' RNA ligase